MREHFAVLQTALNRMRPHAARAWAVTQLWSARGWEIAKRVAVRAAVLARQGFLAALGATESVLLSAKARERVHATAVFTLIFAFLVTSVDFLLTGGPELGPGARAAEYVVYRSPIAAATRDPSISVTGMSVAGIPVSGEVQLAQAEPTAVEIPVARLPAPPAVADLADAEEPKADIVPADATERAKKPETA